MRRNPIALPIQSALALFLTALLAAAAGAQAPTVANGPEPRDGRVVLDLAEQWRVGGGDDDENFLGIIGGAFGDDAGNVYLVDNQLIEVKVYGPDGALLNTLGRQGDGPGEVRSLSTALLMPDGTLGLVQPFPGRVVTVQLDGTPGTSMVPGRTDPTAGGFMSLTTALNRGGTLAFSGMGMSRDGDSTTRTQFLGSFAADGAPRSIVLEKVDEQRRGSREVSELADDFVHLRFDVGPEGRFFVAPERNVYRIDVYEPDGALVRSFGREFESVKRTAEEKARAEDFLQPWRRRRDRMEFVTEDTEPDIVRLHVTDEGETWVLTSRGVRDPQPGVMCVFDVFDAQGIFVRQAALACEGDGIVDGVFPVGGDRYLLVKGYADAIRTLYGTMGDEEPDEDGGMMEIISYRVAE